MGDNNWYFFHENHYFWLPQIKISCTKNIWNINSAQELDKLREYLKVWIACHRGTIDSLFMLISSFQNIEISFLLIVSYIWNKNNLLKWLRLSILKCITKKEEMCFIDKICVSVMGGQIINIVFQYLIAFL
jgi:hypothetical protein